jgi:hypothetical protein
MAADNEHLPALYSSTDATTTIYLHWNVYTASQMDSWHVIKHSEQHNGDWVLPTVGRLHPLVDMHLLTWCRHLGRHLLKLPAG